MPERRATELRPPRIRAASRWIILLVVLVGSFTPILAFVVATQLGIDPRSLQGNGFRMTTASVTLLLVLGGVTIATAAIAYRWVHGRPLVELGFRGPVARNLGLGHALGFVLAAAIVGTRAATATETTLRWSVPAEVSLGSFVGGYAFFVIAVVFLSSFKEELLYRAYPLEVSARIGGRPLVTVLASALLFAACHLVLEEPSVTGFLNRFAFGVLAGILYQRSRSVWLPLGLHNGWNWGLSLVSGNWRMGGLWELSLQHVPTWTEGVPALLAAVVAGGWLGATKPRPDC